jgi:hypothetical protein
MMTNTKGATEMTNAKAKAIAKRSFEARYSGHCGVCDRSIKVGSLIVKNGAGYVHQACAIIESAHPGYARRQRDQLDRMHTGPNSTYAARMGYGDGDL